MKKVGIGLIAALTGAVAGAVGVSYFKNKKIVEKEGKVDKFKDYYNLLNQWLMNKNEGKKIEKYFLDNGYKTIAIYGMGELGNRLYEELKDSEIDVKYAIDKNAESTYSELTVIDLDEDMEPVDVILVTAFFAFEEIQETLEEKVDYPIVSIEDVIYEL